MGQGLIILPSYGYSLPVKDASVGRSGRPQKLKHTVISCGGISVSVSGADNEFAKLCSTGKEDILHGQEGFAVRSVPSQSIHQHLVH